MPSARKGSPAADESTLSAGVSEYSLSSTVPIAESEDDGRASFIDTPRTTAPNADSLGLQSTNFLNDIPIEDTPPPAYGDVYGRVDLTHDGLSTVANLSNDGRVDIHIDQKSRRLSNLLAPALRTQLDSVQTEHAPSQPPSYVTSVPDRTPGQIRPPLLNVVIHVVGSRGDVQPFIALGKVLTETYGHRVRLATHSTFRTFVEENGLEFFSIGGDPAELMAFMVRNPGLMPGKDTLRSGEISRRRKGMYEIMQGCWRSCFEAGDGTGPAISDKDQTPELGFDNGSLLTNKSTLRPFVADAIIANPPSFAHVHCAEKLGVPLHLMFTMPWSPTQSFPHPLANIQASNADPSITNFLSYALVEMMTWQGLGDIVNRFREKSLGLESVNLLWAPGIASRLRIPFTYCWSPALIPKPRDWGHHISISGFYFLDLAGNYSPPPDLAAFLDAGPPPIYIGFGSIVVDDPNAMTELIFQAVRMSGRRALVSKGWGGFGGAGLNVPEGIFMLGNVPHDWLFKRVCCVVHHGGAGTTAAGIALGKPTVVVPFFGDQPFWGAMIAKAGAGPNPIPIKCLTSTKLAGAILEASTTRALQRAQELGAKINSESGSHEGANNFHQALNVDDLRCTLVQSRSAVWRIRRTNVRLSAFAATVLLNEGLLDLNEVKLYRPREYQTEDGPWDPITGGASALLGTIGSLMMGVADFPLELFRLLQNRSSSNDAHVDGFETADKIPSMTHVAPGSGMESASSRNRHDSAKLHGCSTGSHGDPSSPEEIAPGTPEKHLSRAATSHKNADQLIASNGTKEALVDLPRHVSFENALDTGKGIGRIVGAGLKSPMDFTLGLAQGFHNAPRLYGDESVRPADKITGLSSGLKAASKEFGFGFYDGISGLVTQPLQGAKKDGIQGLFKGFGRGIGGVVLKPGAAIWGIPGYTFKGIYKEIQKHLGTNVQNYILAARTAQGLEDFQISTEAERQRVISRWESTRAERVRHKNFLKRESHSQAAAVPGHFTHKRQEDRLQDQVSEVGKVRQANYHDTIAPLAQGNGRLDKHDLEEGGPARVAPPSSTNEAEEDELVERAIRASLGYTNAAFDRDEEVGDEDDDDEGFKRAIQASVAEANQTEHYEHGNNQQLEEALQQSLRTNPTMARDK